jgi:CRISPR/Cas system CSM-associated protein Csm3 (group 7 of RAMP superfamily)
MPIRTEEILLDYRLTFQSPFHFGTGLRAGLIHRTVSRDADGYLYVPGSTIKGALRERCEQLACLFDLRAVSPHGKESALAEFSSNPDIVTRIFGSRFQAGTLFFDAALLVKDDRQFFDHDDEQRQAKYRAWQTEKRTQVSLSRLTGTARAGYLYTSEYGLREMRFDGRIYGTLTGFSLNEDEPFGTYSLLLLLAGLCSLKRLGGKKSAGGGWCDCKVMDLMINGVEQEDPADWLTRLDELEYYQLAREEIS